MLCQAISPRNIFIKLTKLRNCSMILIRLSGNRASLNTETMSLRKLDINMTLGWIPTNDRTLTCIDWDDRTIYCFVNGVLMWHKAYLRGERPKWRTCIKHRREVLAFFAQKKLDLPD